MSTDLNPDPSIEPTTFPPNPTQAPTAPGLPDKEGDDARLQQVADRLAHKGAKAEQNYDNDNSKLFSK